MCLRDSGNRFREKRFDNTPAGRHGLTNWLEKKAPGPARMVIEATGAYSLDLALALHAAESIELVAANPRATRKFAEAQMQRSKTDQVDAQVICDFARRMEFRPWQPPEQDVLELRGIARRMHALTVERMHECIDCVTPRPPRPRRRLSSTTLRSKSATWSGGSRRCCARP